MSFDQPPFEKDAEEYRQAQDRFHLLLGYCIAKWADVEDELFRICWTALQCTAEHAAIVFFRTPTLETRLALITELLGWVIPRTVPGEQPHPDLKTWNDICAEFRKLSPIRNHLAHHPVEGLQYQYWFEPDEPDDGAPEELPEMHSMSDFRSTTSPAKLLRGGVRDELREADLGDHLTKTGHLALSLKAFWFERLSAHVAKLLPPSDLGRPGQTQDRS